MSMASVAAVTAGAPLVSNSINEKNNE